MKKRIIPIIILIAALGLGGLLWSGRLSRENNNIVKLSGNIELTQVDISFKVPGKLIERNVDEGDPVTKGMQIARIDRDIMDQQKARDLAGVESAQWTMEQSKKSIDWQTENVARDIDLRKAELQQAQARLNELLAGSRPQEIQQSRAAVADAQAQHQQAQLDWQRAQTLFKDDDISKSQYDQFRMRFDSTAAALKQAQERLALVEEGPRKEDIDAARAQVAAAQASIRLSEVNRLEVERRKQELDTRRAEVQRAKAQVGMTDAQLADTVVRSPIDGVVLVKSAEIGEVVAAGTTVVSIGDIDHPWMRGYINERDLGRVKLGMKANVTSDSYPGKIYAGRVTFISPQAEFTPKQIQTQEERVKLVYRIKIEVENPNRELKSNMPVEAELVLAQNQ
ncbi:MAG TPA: HlyD family efflux transporter periplasmic adaptor subunit [Bryobacteraceae bacterium]|nr:HlyD family efflux transporter periplasmic adaptor subunit [Bryobacteraceae bacterium]